MTLPDGPPEGFEPIARLSPFNALVGPLYERRDEDSISVGLRIEAKHTNSRGICHGGLLATLADLALGYALLMRAKRRPGSYVTAHLSVDYIRPAKTGDWVQSVVEINGVGRLAFATCNLQVSQKSIARASAVFARAENDA